MVAAVQSALGRFPEDLAGMVRNFNGGKLFVKGIQMVCIFGLSAAQPLPPERGYDWYIDKFTPKWRAAGSGRDSDWAFAMMNYGGLIIMHGDGSIAEWDTAQRIWGARSPNLATWFETILREGDAYMKDV